ncbi:GNAT family N-acetyltransferase [Candidatus Gracilibacteria bacterium]|nr:GNAT family N-acetyltransferase [Candidatus Gracilibacteria bacterium]NJM90391.1 GNAT family N-acetyltransferase [Hydrococcus sp. RU_2_2]NJP20752.1 GNAT family N-acetyltransferase [Hydrococcus sp. CRU_1_1]
MNDKEIVIRETTQADLSIILELIYLKAQFDGCPESVEATHQKLEETLFCGNPSQFILFAQIKGEIVGFASYHYIYSTFLAQSGIWLDDLYLKAEYRGFGIGKAFLKRLCQIAKEKKCGRIDWTVAIHNSRGINFYEKMGAKISQEVRLCRLDRNAIANLLIS